jgi:hypothetical protein
MPHLIRNVAEGVWKNSLLLKVIRLETGKDRRSSVELVEFFDMRKGGTFTTAGDYS